MSVVEGFDAEVVTRQKKGGCAGAEITNGKRKHAVKAFDAIRSLLLVKMKHYLGIGSRGETMALGLQFLAQFAEVINFAVVGDPQAAILVAHGHVAVGRKIENRQPAAAQANV